MAETLVTSEVLSSTFPDEIVADILLRLPVKPICRFKCVSKPWRSFLSNPQFVKAHFKHHNDDPEDLILTSSPSDYAPYILTLSAAGNSPFDGAAKKVRFLPPELKVFATVAGSCHGLVLLELRDAYASKVLFNPITLETAKVNTLETAQPLINLNISYGFGYDSSSDDYKVVCLSQVNDRNGSVVDVYSARMKCWKRTADIPHCMEESLYDGEFAPGVYLNGCIHWLGRNTSNGVPLLLCYDLARDEFEEGLFPFFVHRRLSIELRVLEGCLALVLEPSRNEANFDVWVMREYGVRGSWTKFTTICPKEERHQYKALYNVVCDLNEDEIVVEKNFEKLFAYNRKNGVSRDLAVDGLPECFYRVMPFRESLLSPN